MILAHQPVAPSAIWGAWDLDPLILLTLFLAGFSYARGIKILGKGGRRIGRPRMVAFYFALLLMAAALITPLDAAAHTLFSAHMIQHLVLIVVAAPLIAFASPGLPFLLSLPPSIRLPLQRLRHRLRPVRVLATMPVIAWSLHTAAVWAWHLPSLYQAALRNDLLHGLEHASFLATALLVWAIAIPAPKKKPHYAAAATVIFGTLLQSGALGAILTFATTVLYPAHGVGALLWGLTPLQDQQLAGAIMWIPAGSIYFLALTVLFGSWLNENAAEVGDAAVVGAKQQ